MGIVRAGSAGRGGPWDGVRGGSGMGLTGDGEWSVVWGHVGYWGVEVRGDSEGGGGGGG